MSSKLRVLENAIIQYKEIKKMKFKGEFRSQIERAALSVALNLSEGNARQSIKDKKKFFNISYASNREVQTLLQLSDKVELCRNCDRISAQLYCLQRSLL